MPDLFDAASETEEMLRTVALRNLPAGDFVAGAPGDCEYCGDYFIRIVRGACGKCRDANGLP